MIENLGVQLFTLRNEMVDESSVAQAFKKIKEIGYDHIQPANFCGLAVERFADLARETGLTASKCGTIATWTRILDEPDVVLAEHAAVGATNIGIGWMPPEWRDCPESLSNFIEKANEFNRYAVKNGFTVGYHNHSFEFTKLGGERIIDRLINELDENINFILDTYWIQHGGGDVCVWIEKLADRIEVLHLKDMEMEEKQQLFCEVGNGNMNFDGIMKVADKAGIKTYVVEQDICKGDPFDSIKMSYDFITNNYK